MKTLIAVGLFLLLSLVSSSKGEVGVATLSTLFNHQFPPSKCLDKNSDTFCHSADENNPYFLIEYPTQTSVTEVKIQARKDCCANRVKDVVVVVTDTKPTKGQRVSGKELGSKFVGPASSGQWITFKSESGIVGKYIAIQQQYKGYINWAEVQVKQGPVGEGIPGCTCSDHLEANHSGGNIGACLTRLKGKFWCYVSGAAGSKCPDKKQSSRGRGQLWWSYRACETYTEFQPLYSDSDNLGGSHGFNETFAG